MLSREGVEKSEKNRFTIHCSLARRLDELSDPIRMFEVRESYQVRPLLSRELTRLITRHKGRHFVYNVLEVVFLIVCNVSVLVK